MHDPQFEGTVFMILQKKEWDLSDFDENAARSLRFPHASGTGDVVGAIDFWNLSYLKQIEWKGVVF